MQGDHATVEQMSALLDGQLEGDEARAVRAHVDTCAVCGAQLQQLRATVSMLRAVPAAAPSRSFRVPRVAPSPRRFFRLPSWLFAAPSALRAFAGAAAAVMLVLFVTDASLQPTRQDRPVYCSACFDRVRSAASV